MNGSAKCKGIQNQGVTDDLNCLLQLLFHLPSFRKFIFQIPTQNKDIQTCVSLALQKLFYQLGNITEEGKEEGKEIERKKFVETKELVKSLKWRQEEIYWEHGIIEIEDLLLESLQKEVKGTPIEGFIEKLFQTTMKDTIKCLHIPYETFRIENPLHFGIDIKDCENILQSFQKFIIQEYLEGDNKYKVDGYGFQEATKGYSFLSFPPVLHLHLKRIEYDLEKGKMIKIGSKYNIPDVIDLSEFLSSSLYSSPPPSSSFPPPSSSPSSSSLSSIYYLHAVVVHVGLPSCGQHYVLIRPPPTLSSLSSSSFSSSSLSSYPFPQHWIKFDDSYVSRLEMLDDIHYCNAVMLVYICSSEIEKIFM